MEMLVKIMSLQIKYEKLLFNGMFLEGVND